MRAEKLRIRQFADRQLKNIFGHFLSCQDTNIKDSNDQKLFNKFSDIIGSLSDNILDDDSTKILVPLPFVSKLF